MTASHAERDEYVKLTYSHDTAQSRPNLGPGEYRPGLYCLLFGRPLALTRPGLPGVTGSGPRILSAPTVAGKPFFVELFADRGWMAAGVIPSKSHNVALCTGPHGQNKLCLRRQRNLTLSARKSAKSRPAQRRFEKV